MKVLLISLAVLALASASASAKPVIKVSAVQMRSVPDLSKNIEKMTKYLERLSAQGVRIAVFPECALTSYDDAVIKSFSQAKLTSSLDALAAVCKKNKIAAIVGTPTFPPTNTGKLWNSAVVIDENGSIIERYHKIHLAEEWSQAGDHLALFDIAGTKATIIICHDERYPELVRIPVMAGARLIFYISAESGLSAESKLAPYRAQIQARAVENCVWVVHSNPPANADASGSHGQSRIIKPDGNLQAEASMFNEEVVTADLDIGRGDGLWAKNSLNADFLKAFWEAGLKTLEKK